MFGKIPSVAYYNRLFHLCIYLYNKLDTYLYKNTNIKIEFKKKNKFALQKCLSCTKIPNLVWYKFWKRKRQIYILFFCKKEKNHISHSFERRSHAAAHLSRREARPSLQHPPSVSKLIFPLYFFPTKIKIRDLSSNRSGAGHLLHFFLTFWFFFFP